MENSTEKDQEPPKVINKAINQEQFKWAEILTTIDLSKKDLKNIDEHIKFPPKLCHLDLSDNLLENVPVAVLKIKHLKSLNLQSNRISIFDDTPAFCHSIENLNLGQNLLKRPPLWVWTKSPNNLAHLDINSNFNIHNSFQTETYEKLLQSKTLVTNIKISNCKLRECLEILGTFPKAEVFEIGSPDHSRLNANYLVSVPCSGLDKCCDIKKLILSNTSIYSINTNIHMYTSLVEINLSHNYIHDIPKEFCNLENLEICVLSYNSIMYLPDDILKLEKLVYLCLDNNNLCMLPKGIGELPCLATLDVYNNCIYEISEDMKQIRELDLAQNFFEEPQDEEYLQKKEKIRLNKEERVDGSKTEPEIKDNDDNYSTDTSDEEYMEEQEQPCTENKHDLIPNGDDSSEEDWDSDAYWIPGFYYHNTMPSRQPVKTWSLADQVTCEKMCRQAQYESDDGQFDDYSGDES